MSAPSPEQLWVDSLSEDDARARRRAMLDRARDLEKDSRTEEERIRRSNHGLRGSTSASLSWSTLGSRRRRLV